MATINKPSQPLIPPTDVEEVEEIAANAAEAAIAADDTHAPLVDDKVPAEHLPSYVDDVLNFDTIEDFPEEGEEGKIYVANDTNLTYRWSGVAYIQVGGNDLIPHHHVMQMFIPDDWEGEDFGYLIQQQDPEFWEKLHEWGIILQEGGINSYSFYDQLNNCYILTANADGFDLLIKPYSNRLADFEGIGDLYTGIPLIQAKVSFYSDTELGLTQINIDKYDYKSYAVDGFDGIATIEVDPDAEEPYNVSCYVPEHDGVYKLYDTGSSYHGWIVFDSGIWIACDKGIIERGSYVGFQPGDRISFHGDKYITETNLKTINGQSILGSGNLEIGLSQSAEAEVQSMIDTAIGNVLNQEF